MDGKPWNCARDRKRRKGGKMPKNTNTLMLWKGWQKTHAAFERKLSNTNMTFQNCFSLICQSSLANSLTWTSSKFFNLVFFCSAPPWAALGLFRARSGLFPSSFFHVIIIINEWKTWKVISHSPARKVLEKDSNLFFLTLSFTINVWNTGNSRQVSREKSQFCVKLCIYYY